MLLNVQTKPTVKQPPGAFIERQLSRLKMSPTVLEAYLRCPLQFYYQYIIGLRATESPNYFYGLALHKAIELLTRQFIRTGNWDTATALDFFYDAFDEYKLLLSATDFEKWLARGNHYLPLFTSQPGLFTQPVAAVEWRADLLHLDDIPLTGVIDRIDQTEGSQPIIVDYKTSIAKEQSENPKNITGDSARYWRQMQFYTLLLELSPDWPGVQPQTSVVVAIEQSAKGYFEYKNFAHNTRSQDDIKTLVRTVWQRIRQHDFITGCGKDDCSWCHLSRLQKTDATADLDDLPPHTLSPF